MSGHARLELMLPCCQRSFCSFLANWPHLSFLSLTGVYLRPSINPSAALAAAPTTALTTLCLSLFRASSANILATLINASATTLLRLELEDVPSDGLDSVPDEVVSALLAVAPRLRSLVVRPSAYLSSIPSTSTPLDAILSALVEVRALDLRTCGLTLSTILPRLQTLQNLYSVAIAGDAPYDFLGGSPLLSSTAVVDFLVNSASIRAFTLSLQFSTSWSAKETEMVQSTAQTEGVKFGWA